MSWTLWPRRRPRFGSGASTPEDEALKERLREEADRMTEVLSERVADLQASIVARRPVAPEDVR
jgi:hypothetical protein